MTALGTLVCEDTFYYKRHVFLNTTCGDRPYFAYTLPPRDAAWKTIVYHFPSSKLKKKEEDKEWDWDIFKTNILEPCLQEIYYPNRSFAFLFEEIQQMKTICEHLHKEYNFTICETVGMVLRLKDFSPTFYPCANTSNEYTLQSSLQLQVQRCNSRQDLLVYHKVNWLAWEESNEEIETHLHAYSSAMNLEQTVTILGQEYPLFSYFIAYDISSNSKLPVACSAMCYHFETNSCFIFGVGTIPTYQKKGLGTLMTQVCVNEAKEKYGDLIQFCTMTSMPAGASIYAKLGFIPVNKVMYMTHFGERKCSA